VSRRLRVVGGQAHVMLLVDCAVIALIGREGDSDIGLVQLGIA
jgi:hypothetical protein